MTITVNELHQRATRETRLLPNGKWLKVGPEQWRKVCTKCDGTGYLPGYEFIDNARCWRCGTCGLEAGVRLRSTTELDAKERQEIAERARQESKREQERAAALILAAEQDRKDEELRRKAEAEAQAKRDASRHLDAEPGEKVEISGIVVLARSIETASYSGWGVDHKMLIGIDCGDGVTVKTFTQSQWSWDVKKGDVVTITARVKAHGEYRGLRETTVTHPKMTSITKAEGDES